MAGFAFESWIWYGITMVMVILRVYDARLCFKQCHANNDVQPCASVALQIGHAAAG